MDRVDQDIQVSDIRELLLAESLPQKNKYTLSYRRVHLTLKKAIWSSSRGLSMYMQQNVSSLCTAMLLTPFE